MRQHVLLDFPPLSAPTPTFMRQWVKIHYLKRVRWGDTMIITHIHCLIPAPPLQDNGKNTLWEGGISLWGWGWGKTIEKSCPRCLPQPHSHEVMGKTHECSPLGPMHFSHYHMRIGWVGQWEKPWEKNHDFLALPHEILASWGETKLTTQLSLTTHYHEIMGKTLIELEFTPFNPLPHHHEKTVGRGK